MNTKRIKRTIVIRWKGPFSIKEIIKSKNNDEKDYGVYQVYGCHILYKNNTLLYIGQAVKETFSQRFRDHEKNLLSDDDPSQIRIYLGELNNSHEYTAKDGWRIWYRDVDIAESTLIYKYLPPYNGSGKSEYPTERFQLAGIKLLHTGDKGRLEIEDKLPRDYKKH
jgi:hypothetical protein